MYGHCPMFLLAIAYRHISRQEKSTQTTFTQFLLRFTDHFLSFSRQFVDGHT